MFSALCRYVRTDSRFWNFSWELCGTGLTSSLHCLPPSIGTNMNLSDKNVSVSEACMFTYREEQNVVPLLTSLHVCAPTECVCVCVCTEPSEEKFYTNHARGTNNADVTVLDVHDHFFCTTTICSCRKFAFLPTEHHGSLRGSDPAHCCTQLEVVTVPSHTTAEN